MTRAEIPHNRHLRIAFYAPLKAPTHPVPSGDRLMARQLIACLEMAGHQVKVISDLRAYIGDAQDEAAWVALQSAAQAEVARIGADWTAARPPDLWLCYHPYYKAPDLLGPVLSQRFSVPYITIESSLSGRRNIGIWAVMQAHVLAGVRQARVNLCLTERDLLGLHQHLPAARTARLAPFIDISGFTAPPQPQPGHLVTVAMMRAGDKADSYRRLAATLALLPPDLAWRLTVAGDGPLRAEVQALFAALPDRITWAGQQTPAKIAALLAQAMVYVWPGCGEAYGLAYLEAQAAGVPVVAQNVAGVPAVVADGETGFLTPPGDDPAAADAITRLLRDPALQRRMGQAARARVLRDHTITGAAQNLSAALHTAIGALP